jgi:hypothetical protein
MNALRALGLAWIVLGAAPTGASAQTTAPSPPPPIRLPGIVYPAPAEARTEPSAPALKPQGPTSRIHGAPSTPASPRPVVADPPQPPRAGSLAIVNGRDIPVAAVTVAMESETVRHVEPLAPNAQAVLKLPQMKGCVATIEALYEGGEVSAIGTFDVCKVKLVRLIE